MTLSAGNHVNISYRTPREKDYRLSNENEKFRNMLISSLQMQHIVVLAGSGCSIFAGGPSMRKLWDIAIGKENNKMAMRISKRVHHNLNDPNIELFLSKIEAYLQVNEIKTYRNYLNSCKGVILNECSAFIDSGNLSAHKTFLHRLSRRRARDQRLKIFTTNYDLCFETAAAALGCVAIDGFSFSSPSRYDPRFFGYDIVRRPRNGEDLSQYLEGVFLLHKLHGSVNWERVSTDQGEIIKMNSSPNPEKACLIYPAKGKYQQSYIQPYLESMSQYLSALREPNTCVIVIGFGFNDDHLSEPLYAAAKSNPHLRLIIVDPNAEGKDGQGANTYWTKFSQLADFGEDMWFVSASFETFAENIPDLKALTPAENLMKAVRDVQDHRGRDD